MMISPIPLMRIEFDLRWHTVLYDHEILRNIHPYVGLIEVVPLRTKSLLKT
jgi:hypothetical protein